MALVSPGVEVQVIDESFYLPSGPSTVPLIIIASQENKPNSSGTGVAVGTLKTNAGVPFLLTSQRDLGNTFGDPLFQTDNSQNPVHGGELNEYGLQAAYSFLGVSNAAWVIRADVDTKQLLPTTTAPTSDPLNGTYWLDTGTSHWGIFQWNGDAATVAGGQKFTNIIPLVITDETQLDMETMAPLGAVGVIGTYAIVAVSTSLVLYYKNYMGMWVEVGSEDWYKSWPTVKSNKSNPVITTGNTFKINDILVTASSNNLSALKDDINALTDLHGVSADVVNSRLQLFSNGNTSLNVQVTGSGSISTSVITVTSAAGIDPGMVITDTSGKWNGSNYPATVLTVDGTTITYFQDGDLGEQTNVADFTDISIIFSDYYLETEATGFIGDNTLTVASTGGIKVGNYVYGTGITYGTQVTAVDAVNRIVYLSTNNSGVVNGTIEVSNPRSNAIVLAVGTGNIIKASASDSVLGLAAGTYYGPELSIQSSSSVPRYKARDVNPRPTGSLWIKTSNINLGAYFNVKIWSSETSSWNRITAPVYENGQAATYGLDLAGGGKNIDTGTLYVQYNVSESIQKEGVPSYVDYKIFRRKQPDPTVFVSKVIDSTTFPQDSSGFTFTGSISGNILTVTNLNLGTITTDQVITGTGVAPGTIVTNRLSRGVKTVAVSGTFSGKTTTVGGGSNPYTIPSSAISAPDLVDGAKPVLRITFDTATTATVTVVSDGYGYTSAPTISGAALQALGGGTGTVILTATLDPLGEEGTYRVNISQTVSSGTLTATTYTKMDYSFTMSESLVGKRALDVDRTIEFTADAASTDAQLLAATINSAGFTNVEANVDSMNRLVIKHHTGGEIRLSAGMMGEGMDDALAALGYTGYDINTGTGTANLYTAPDGDTAHDFIATNWEPLIYTASSIAPYRKPTADTLWYFNVVDQVDIMIHNGDTWVGYLDPTSPNWDVDPDFQTDPMGPIVAATKPTTQSDGTSLRGGDIWIDTSDIEHYPMISVWDRYGLVWVPVDNTDHTTENGIIFADARYNVNGANSDEPGAIEDLLLSNFVDWDTPDPALYPRGMLLFNTRRSGFNVKKFAPGYINTTNGAINLRFNSESMEGYAPDRWISASGSDENFVAYFGRHAQRAVVINHLKAMVDTNQDIRDDERRSFNLMACPGYVELINNMINLNIDRKHTAFIVGDAPFRLTSDATSLINYFSNAAIAVDNNDKGMVSYDEYLGVYYPSGYTTDNTGNPIVVPASHMVLRTIALSDSVSYPWFAPAGTRRGIVNNATASGYVDYHTGEFKSIALNNGQRDTLYQLNVNPITFLTGAGLTVFGQKTRASNASAMDRVNVARLIVYLRGQLSRLAKPYLFEPNDKTTRDSVKATVESLMLELVGKRAIYDYLVVCDTSNNTPSRIDANELYIDVAIEPVKAIEFIYIPIRIKNTGAIAGLSNK